MDKLIYWLLAVLPALPYLFITVAYRRIAKLKLAIIKDTLGSSEQLSDLYTRAFGPHVVDRLYALHFHWRAYVCPVSVNMFLVAAVAVISFGRLGIYMGLPHDLQTLLSKLPSPVFGGIVGAYVWGLYDVLRRYRSYDLSPTSLHFMWLRLLIAAGLGALAGAALKSPVDVLAAFGLGAFPVKTLHSFAKEQARRRYNISGETVPSERPRMDNLQGLTKDVIDRLSEEEIGSPQHLANKDPVKLLFGTNFEWKVILDFIDQAMLFNYVGEKIRDLRPIGIRGAIELAEVGLALENPETKERATSLLKLIAEKLEENEEGVRNLIHTLVDDTQVNFIWTLWGEISPTGGGPTTESEGAGPSSQDPAENAAG